MDPEGPKRDGFTLTGPGGIGMTASGLSAAVALAGVLFLLIQALGVWVMREDHRALGVALSDVARASEITGCLLSLSQEERLLALQSPGGPCLYARAMIRGTTGRAK